jgi:hypothetical protein
MTDWYQIAKELYREGDFISETDACVYELEGNEPCHESEPDCDFCAKYWATEHFRRAEAFEGYDTEDY